VQVPRVYLEWRGPAAYTADEPALDMAAEILGEGKSSRLYKRLVYDEKIAQNVVAGDNTDQLAGTFEIVVTAKPGVDPRRLCKEVLEEVAALAAKDPEARELERAVNSHESGYLAQLESTLSRATQIANYDVLARDPDYFAKDLARYRAVTTAQVRAAAAKYLVPSQRVTLIINPGARSESAPLHSGPGKKPQENK
jgi:zinc protease